MGGVCISDEVQTGFGRTGSHYWGFEAAGAVPDIGILLVLAILVYSLVHSKFWKSSRLVGTYFANYMSVKVRSTRAEGAAKVGESASPTNILTKFTPIAVKIANCSIHRTRAKKTTRLHYNDIAGP